MAGVKRPVSRSRGTGADEIGYTTAMSLASRLTTPPVPPTGRAVVYPDSDGEPMSDNTLQAAWIDRMRGGIGVACPDAFVAGNLLWYYQEGDPTQRIGPDVMVAFGRPRGERGSYMQWREAGIAPQVVIEVWSPGNSFAEQIQKHALYERLGVEEFIAYDPDRNNFAAYERNANGRFEIVAAAQPWISPRTGCRFVPGPDGLKAYRPDGEPFRTSEEAGLHAAELDRLAKENAARADENAARADENAAKADEHAARSARLEAQLRALGIEPT